LGVLAALPLVVSPDHLPWLRFRVLSWELLVFIVVLFLLQVHLQSKEDDERSDREQAIDNLLARIETAKPDPAPIKEEPSTPLTQPRQPHLMFTATQQTGKNWRDGPVFTLNHLSGGGAEYVEIDPIQSARGHNLWIRFGGVPLLSSEKRKPHHHFGEFREVRIPAAPVTYERICGST
jgi:hypothetical protein